MDCLRAQELLSENADGRAVPVDELAAARAHCDHCAECAAFERGLALLAAAGHPSAPAELVDSILESMSTAGADKQAFAEDVLRPHAGTRDLRPSWWAPRLTVLTTAAVFLLAALTITTIGFTGGLKQLTSEEEAALDTLSEEESLSRNGSAPQVTDQTESAVMGSVMTAPAYISVNGRVYLVGTPAEADRSTLSTVGPVDGQSGEDTDTPLYAYRADIGEARLLTEDNGGWVTYEPVTRRFAGTEYQLTTRTPMTADGIWPDLPAIYPVPDQADGSPTFRFFGYDELGVKVYVPASGSEKDGFAVAPGTAPDDPAAGSPNWTWWVPLP